MHQERVFEGVLTTRSNRQLGLYQVRSRGEWDQGVKIPTKTPLLTTVIGTAYPGHGIRES